MNRTLRMLACATLLSSSYLLSGCCTVLEGCFACADCLLGPSLPSLLVSPTEAPADEIDIEVADTATTTVSY